MIAKNAKRFIYAERAVSLVLLTVQCFHGVLPWFVVASVVDDYLPPEAQQDDLLRASIFGWWQSIDKSLRRHDQKQRKYMCVCVKREKTGRSKRHDGHAKPKGKTIL